jgi:hypothetical protein
MMFTNISLKKIIGILRVTGVAALLFILGSQLLHWTTIFYKNNNTEDFAGNTEWFKNTPEQQLAFYIALGSFLLVVLMQLYRFYIKRYLEEEEVV